MSDDQSTPDHVVLVETFARSSPDQLFQYFVDPDLLVQWWPQTAEVEPRLGGTYHLAWPSMNWHLRGDYTEFSPGDVLAFTWKWDHDRAKPVRTVRITLAPVETGTKLEIVHGTYTGSAEDQEERQGHIEGWAHFLEKLGSISSSRVQPS